MALGGWPGLAFETLDSVGLGLIPAEDEQRMLAHGVAGRMSGSALIEAAGPLRRRAWSSTARIRIMPGTLLIRYLLCETVGIDDHPDVSCKLWRREQ
jgi:hypothetical protein